MKNYKEAIEYIESANSGLTNNNLDNISKVLNYYDNPQDKLKYIHVAGTNGKGSCCSMLNSILTNANYNVGLFTSPHLIEYTERFIYNNKEISKKSFTKYVSSIQTACNKLKTKLSTFEILTVVAFLYFNDLKCDIAILEVGLGGRFDATNVIVKPLLSIIMNIGLDHTTILGNTKEKIAKEKAGIIKQDSNVVVYDNDDKIINIFKRIAKNNNSSILVSNFDEIEILKEGLNNQFFSYKNYKNIKLSLLGKHQFKNAAVVLDACNKLIDLGYKLRLSDIKNGLKNTKWYARLSILDSNPLFLLDGAHNPQCASALVESLPKLVFKKKIYIICGMLKDKDYKKVVKMFVPFAKEFICLTPNSYRALDANSLVNLISNYGLPANSANSISDAIKMAYKKASKNDVILAFGSLYLAGDILAYFLNHKNELK